MEINRYIKDLLLEHDCVVIPGLGGFIGSPMRAEVQGITKTITPPGKKITFNGQLQRNDGLLVHHISLTEGISYDEAEQGVQQFVKASKKRLEQSGLIIFPEVGKLMADAGGTISFHPTPGRNLLQESFGLKPVHYRQTFDTVSETEEKTTLAPLQPVRQDKGKVRSFVSTYGMSVAAMLVLGVFIVQGIYFQPLALENFGFFQPKSFFSSQNETPTALHSTMTSEPVAAGSLEVSGTLETLEEPSTPINNDDTAPTTEAAPTPAPVVEPTATKTVTPAPTNAPHVTEINSNDVDAGYYIILGAYASKRNANKFIKEQKLSGLVIIPSNGLLRVALPVGNIATEAYQQLEKQRQQENPAAWLVYNNK